MKRNSHITAFYLETLLLIVIFLAIILLLTNIIGLGRVQSASAKELTSAVTLAQNAAEVFCTAETPEEAAAILNEDGTARLTDGSLEAGYNADMTPCSPEDPDLLLRVAWQPAAQDGLVNYQISVLHEEKTVYEMTTAVSRKEASA